MVTDRYLTVHHHATVVEFKAWCDENKLPIIGIDNLPISKSLESADLPKKCVMLFGQEGAGMSDEGVAVCSVVLAGIINATTPLMTMVFMLLLFKEQKLKSEQIIGLFIGAFGVMVVLGIWKGIGDNQLLGVAALLLAVSCYGYSFPYMTRNILPLGLSAPL